MNTAIAVLFAWVKHNREMTLTASDMDSKSLALIVGCRIVSCAQRKRIGIAPLPPSEGSDLRRSAFAWVRIAVDPALCINQGLSRGDDNMVYSGRNKVVRL